MIAAMFPLSTNDARRWCETLAARLPVQHIHPDGVPYLDRYFVSGYLPPDLRRGAGSSPVDASVYLHHFVGSDPGGGLHSHPWVWALSVILVGSYRETRCAVGSTPAMRDYRPGDTNLLRATDVHRVDLLTPDAWSLLLVGPYAQPWSFVDTCA